LGSDVPYFLNDGSALARGRGEVLEYFALIIPYTILLCTPMVHVSTAWAYSLVKPGSKEHPSNLKEILLEGLRNPTDLSRHLENDFEPVVFEAYPLIRNIKDLMLQEGAVYASLSGSGSSVFGFFTDHNQARSVSEICRSWNCQVFFSPPHFSPMSPPHKRI
jgi:4-diphosphocytidyl-2-C-methyl-D-erythritol kinase